MRSARVPLRRSRRTARLAGGGVRFFGKPLTVSAPAEERYRDALTQLVDQMATETHAGVKKLFETHAPHLIADAMDASAASQARILMNAMGERFATLFQRIAPGLAAKMADDVNRASKSNLHASLREVSGGLSLKTTVITGQVAEATKAAVAANVALIKSIPDEYFTKIQGDVFRSIQQGNGLQDVLGAVVQTGAVTRRRAVLIAKDQTSKATTAINSARMKALGIKKFEWLHSAGGVEPRPLHIGVLNRRIFSLADPPIIDERTGERGLPGQLINCRCRMVPVVDFGASEEDDDSAEG